MARRQLLTDEQWARLLAPPSDEREIVRYWTLSREDFGIIFRKRSDHSRLGFALLLCYLRYPGRVLGAEEVPPVALVSFVARQLGVSPAAFIRYSRRDQTRREQLAELMERLSYRSFDRASFLHYLAWLTPIAQNVQRPDLLVEMLLEDLRRHRVLIPTRRMLELLLHQARSRAERLVYRALTNGLTDTQGDALDTLLNQKPEAATSWMGWLRQLPQAPAARNILALIERLRFVRELGIDADRQRSVSVSAFERLATDCLRTTVQHVRELALPRRRAMLVAAVVRLESAVTDATLFMFDKLLGSMSRKAERQTADKSFQTLREVQGHLRTLTAACRAMIQATESTADPVAAVEQRVGWEKFVQCVAEAENLARPETTDIRAELITKYPTIRCFAGAFLDVFEFRGGGAVSNLLKALALISEMYRAGKRTLPLKPPTAFIRRAWRPFMFKDGDIDRRAYELCVFSELRNRLRAGDVWVDRSRQYQDFETYLIPKLGRIERTLFTLDWLKNIDLRRRANAGLNKGEARNALARAIFFYRLGEIRDRSFESQVYRASGLNLLIAAIILWNTRYLEQAFVQLGRQGVNVAPTIVTHVAPLGWEHIGLTGDYVWSDGEQPPKDAFRPLRRRESMLAA